jgi:hypothetical protein
MAYNELSVVKRAVVGALAPLMPTDPETGDRAPIEYAWPGEQLTRPLHVFTANGRTTSTPSTMGAGRKRRDQSVSFDVIIECRRTGETVDGEGRNVLQEQADELVETVAGIIDQWVADNPTLGLTEAGDVPVDYATFDSFTLEHGPLATGVGARGICQITYRIRPK